MQVLGCLFFAFLGVVLFLLIGALAILQKVLQAFGINVPWFKFIKTGNFQDYTQQQTGNPQQNASYSTGSEQIEKKKIYTEEEGEYVDFEEVKDE